MRKVFFLAIALAFISVQTNGSISFSGNKIDSRIVKNKINPAVLVSVVDELAGVEDNISGEVLNAIPAMGGLPAVPDAPAPPAVTNNCGNTVLTRETPPAGISWYWQGTSSNGTSTSLFGSTYTATSDGTYYIRAKDNTTGEWSSSTSVIVVVNTIPATPSTPSLASYCAHSVLTQGTPPSNVTWYWQGTNPSGQSMDNFSSTNNVTVDGTYYLRARNNTSGCWSTSSAFKSITITTLPDAPLNPTITSNSCGSSVLTKGTQPAFITWYWQGTSSNGTSTSNANSTLMVTVDGTYYLRAYKTSTGCWSAISASITVDVNDPPAVPSAPTIFFSSCESVKLGHANAPAGITWYWQGTTSTGTSTVNSDATYDISSNGTFYLRARNDVTGCWSTTSASIVVSSFSPPAQPTTPTLAPSICGSSVLTRVTSPTDVTWYWQGQNANGTSIDNSATTLSVTNDGTYYLRAKNNITGCWSTSSSYVNVDIQEIPSSPELPIITSTSCTSVVIAKYEAPSGISWCWQGTNANGTTLNSNINYTITTSGTYYLRANKGSCWGPSTALLVSIDNPPAPNTPNIVSTSCEKVTFSMNGIPSAEYNWYWQGKQASGTSILNSSSTYEATSNGTYYLRSRNISTCCWGAEATIVVNSINPPTEPTIPTIVTDNCDGIVLARSNPPAGETWYWQGTNSLGTETTNSNGNYTATIDGTYYIRSRNDATGCWSIVSTGKSLNIKDVPTKPIEPLVSTNGGNYIFTSGTPSGYVNWYWQGTNGNGTSLSDENPSYTTNVQGIYYLRAYNYISACWSVESASASTDQIQSFSAPPAPIIVESCGNSLLKQNGTPPQGITYYWQGNNSTGTNTDNSATNYTVTVDGVYYIRARHDATGNWSSSTPIVVDVKEIPEAPLSPTQNSRCSVTDLMRENPPTGITWYWQGTNSNFYSTSNTSSVYGVTTDGTYYLRALSERGCWSTNSTPTTVVVNANPPTPSNPTLQSSSCGSSILAQGTPASGITWYWQGNMFNGTNTNYSNSTYTAEQDGTYYLRAKDDVTGCWSTTSSSLVVNVNDLPYTPTPPYISYNVCGQTLLKKYNPPPGATWYWQSAIDGQSTTNSGSSYPVTSDGIYYLRASNSSGCWSTSSSSITVDVQDIPAIGVQPLSPIFCEGSPATYSITATGTGVKLQWQRSTNNGSSWENLLGETGSNLVINSITPLMQGQLFKCKVTGDCPTVVYSNVVTLNVSSLPVLYSITGGESYCSGSPGVTIGLSGSQIGINYQLKLDGNNVGTTISGTGSSISFGEQLVAGTYTIVAANTDGCTRIMNGSKTVTVLTTPIAAISAERTLVTCLIPSSILTATGDGSYQWSYDNGIIMEPVTAQITVSPELSTTYKVTVTNINGCTATATQEIVADKIKSVAPISINADNTSLCLGASTTLTVTGGSLGNGATWKWYNGSCNGTYVGTGATITVTPSKTTTYFVNAVGDCNTTECVSITVNVYPLPSITDNPISQTVFQGDPVTFAVTSPETDIIYQWLQSTSENVNYTPVSGANTTSHTISSVTAGMDKTYYKCRISNTTCPTTYKLSQFAILQVYNSDKIVHSQPLSSIIKLGEQATYSLECDSRATNLQWQRKKSTESEFTDISGETSATLAFTTTEDLNYAQFRCKFSINGIIYYSQVATLTLILPYTEPELSNLNYIYTIAPLVPIKNLSELSSKTMKDVGEQVKYFDGLGRPSQIVAIRTTPSYKDLVQPVVYDDYGRESEKYLPYEDKEGSSGSFRDDTQWGTRQTAYYNANFDSEGAFAKAKINYEESPLNRVLSQRGVGADWVNKESSYIYGTNSSTDVKYFSVASDNSLVLNGNYSEGKLTLLESKDEDNRVIQEWKDLAGQVVLKRSYTGLNKTGDVAETYYVYDDMGRLRYVLPPKMVENLGETTSFAPTAQLVTDLCFYYLYDERGRIIEKRIPGADPVFMVYDLLDRLVLTQDGEQRKNSQWIANTYDAFGRPLKSGLVTITGVANTQDAAQTWFNSNPNSLDESISSSNGVLLVQNWYDTYDGLPTGFDDLNYTLPLNLLNHSYLTMPEVPSSRTRGMLTAQEIRVLNPEVNKPTFLKSKTFYDKDGRTLRTISQSYEGGYLCQSYKYDWSGKVLNEELIIDQPIIVTLEREMTYDLAGRVTHIKQRVDGGTPISVAANEYDALGKNTVRRLGLNGSNRLQDLNYKYNIRGWLTDINNPDDIGRNLFAMRLNYQKMYTMEYDENDPLAQPQYTGNITEFDWAYRDGNPEEVKRMAYRYTYDGLSRLTQGLWYSNTPTKWSRELSKYDTKYQYDVNGNLSTLQRYGISETGNQLIDNLSYTYKSNQQSNQLVSVTDHSLKSEGYNDTNTSEVDFTYNGNGSMITDLDKDINVTYNYLNLPQRVEEVKTTDQHSVNYVYTATGQKLAALYLNGSTLMGGNRYIGSMVYAYSTATSSWNPDYIQTSEGRLTYKGSAWVPQYFLTDHLGNIRSIAERRTEFDSETGWARQIWQQNYYPFGMALGQGYVGSGETNQLCYNGKEKQDFALNGHSLDWLDYGARFYDPEIGRWFVIDNKAEKYFSVSQYVYALNNSIKFIDPDGNDVQVSFTDKTHEAALRNLLSTEEGRAFVGRYMKANTELYGYKFSKNGDRANDLLVLKSAEMYNQNDPNGGGKIGDDHTYTKDGLFYASDAQSESEVQGGFREVIRLDIGLNEVDATIALGHETFVHADKAADKLTQINEKIKAGGYKNFGEIVKDLVSIVKSGKKDHESLKKGEVKKFENFSKKLAKEKKNEQYNKKYEEDKSNPNL